MAQTIFEKLGGTYIKVCDYYIPDLKLADEVYPDNMPLGKYGLLRESYLKEHKSALYNHLLLTGKLRSHLHDVEQQAQQLLDTMVPQMMKLENVTEKLKATNQLEWVARMNNIKARIEEIIFSEIVYK